MTSIVGRFALDSSPLSAPLLRPRVAFAVGVALLLGETREYVSSWN